MNPLLRRISGRSLVGLPPRSRRGYADDSSRSDGQPRSLLKETLTLTTVYDDSTVRALHPDWYRWPRADDDPRMIGDYPNVPATSYQLRDPYDPTYFDPQERRRFGEPVPED